MTLGHGYGLRLRPRAGWGVNKVAGEIAIGERLSFGAGDIQRGRGG